ncbi:MAG: hypothetical protein FJ125_01665 [Deltaproteobacteria bacterium]|nr:hypothetical protein [Deltaproteobacteria bacterium]
MSVIIFEPADFSEDLPPAGAYPCTVTSVRLARSAGGNRMVVVTFRLEGLRLGRSEVIEYLVLEAGNPRAVAISRRRLLQLVRACGLEPEPGTPLRTAELVGARLQVRVEHDSFKGAPRLRVVEHCPLDLEEAAAPATAGQSGPDEDFDFDSVPF